MNRGIVLPIILFFIAFIGTVLGYVWIASQSTLSLFTDTKAGIYSEVKKRNNYFTSLVEFPPGGPLSCFSDSYYSLCALFLHYPGVNFSSLLSQEENCSPDFITDQTVNSFFPQAPFTCTSIFERQRFATHGNIHFVSDASLPKISLLVAQGTISTNRTLLIENNITIVAGSHIAIESLIVPPNITVILVTPQTITIPLLTTGGFLITIDKDGPNTYGRSTHYTLENIHFISQMRWGFSEGE